MEYALEELMVVEASRHIHDGEIVLAGTGIPLITIPAAIGGLSRPSDWRSSYHQSKAGTSLGQTPNTQFVA